MCMANKILYFTVLLITAVALVNIPVACSAQPVGNTQLNNKEILEELTADQQGETKQDREITQKIRRAVANDKSLSTNAHNVKIITVGGMVTLKGPVRSELEKKTIEDKAAQIAGNGNIHSEIDVAP